MQATIGEYADYLDTGLWTIKSGKLIPPTDLTPAQLSDFQLVFGELVAKGNVDDSSSD